MEVNGVRETFDDFFSRKTNLANGTFLTIKYEINEFLRAVAYMMWNSELRCAQILNTFFEHR